MDNATEVTAEFSTEEIKKEAAVLEVPAVKKPDSKSWIPFAVGLITLAIMVAIAFRFWLAL